MAALIGVAGLTLEARIIAGTHIRTICSGDGRMLTSSLTRAISEDCRGLISFGIAGGLSPDVRAGTCVVASTIISGATRITTDEEWSISLLCNIPGALHGAIAGVSNSVVAHPEAKRALYANTGALAVDNESHVVGSVAAAHALPMAAVRVVLDSAARELPHSALAARRADGTIDIAALVRLLIRNPFDQPMLLRTALDALIGFSVLARCRYLLGPSLGFPVLRCAAPRRRQKGQ